MALVRFFRAQQTTAFLGGRALTYAARWAATLVAVLICLLFVTAVQDTEHLRTSEVQLACAQMIGAALALILSLSIIPAQRAAEAFSPAILQLYAQDPWLVAAFLILVLTTSVSVLLGTNFAPEVDPRISIAIQFLLLGISLDALRSYYKRTLDLLNPQTAIHLVVRKCARLVTRVGRIVERLTRIQALALGSSETTAAARAIYFSASQIAGALRFWIAQLDEIAHKLVPRRDTSGVNDIVTGMSKIGRQYSETRRNSLLLLPDFNNIFAGGVSDVADVLNPIYESIRVICEDAAKSSNELVVKHCVETLAAMTTHAMTIVHSSNGELRKAPLAFSPCYWLGLCSTTAIKHDMADAALAAISGFQTILLKQTKELYTPDIEAQSLESLSTLVFASYLKNDVLGFPGIKAMLLAAHHDILLRGYRDTPTLKTVLQHVRMFTPYEIRMEKAGKRKLQIFPPFDPSLECSVPALLELVANQVKRSEQRWINPFDEFLEAAADVRHFYQELSQTDFENQLLRKWIVDSMLAAARVHWGLLVRPPEGTEHHIDEVDKSLRWLVSWVPAFFPEKTTPHKFHSVEAADTLACLGISLLEQDRIETANACVAAIAGLAMNSVGCQPDPYFFADLQERIEVLARASDALGKSEVATAIRGKIERPVTIGDDAWPDFLEARQTRWCQLDDSLEERRRYGFRDDPVAELQRILNTERMCGASAL